jgi:hypothetical protein
MHSLLSKRKGSGPVDRGAPMVVMHNTLTLQRKQGLLDCGRGQSSL